MYTRPRRSSGATGYTMVQIIKDWKSGDHFRKYPCVSRLNLVEIWMQSSRILFGMLMPGLCHFSMLCNSPRRGQESTLYVCCIQLIHATATSVDLHHHHFRQLWQP